MSIPFLNDIEEVQTLQHLKEQGRVFLKSNQVDKALRIYANILQNYPEDVDSLIVLGDGYLIAGDSFSAYVLLQKAFKIDPSRRDIKRRLENFQPAKLNQPDIEDVAPYHSRSIFQLIQKLTGKTGNVTEYELKKASEIMERFSEDPAPEKTVAENFEEINALLPAIIELNIHQAEKDGQFDVVDTLQNLLSNMLVQQDMGLSSSGTPLYPVNSEVKKKQIIFYSIDSKESPLRQASIQQMFIDLGCDVHVPEAGSTDQVEQHADIAVFHNPHGSSTFLKKMAAFAAKGLPVIVDLDTDFYFLPECHPDFPFLGIHDIETARSYQASLQLASLIIVPTEEAGKRIRDLGFAVQTIPDSWDQRNSLWLKPAAPRSTLNLGILAQPDQLEDINAMKRIINRLMREFPHTRLVIYGALSAYQVFDTIPDNRRLYLPQASPEDYPFLLSQMDVLLAPAQISPFNHVRSDRILMEAGIKKIPWLAAPIKPFLNWGTGGLLAESQDAWYAQLIRLIQDHELRSNLGRSGFQQALKRETQQISVLWGGLLKKISDQSWKC